MSIMREMRRSKETDPFFCQECKCDKRKGYKIALGVDDVGYNWPSLSICDDCLKAAK